MRTATGVDDRVARVADRFLRLVADGRGDAARGRNLYVLRFLDALARPDHPLHLPYRPTRNPAAFLAMLFDLVGDALHGYGERLEGGADPVDDGAAAVRRHLAARLAAPWGELLVELERAGLAGLAAVAREAIEDGLRRPAVSDLPAHLATVASWMSDEQHDAFDVDGFVRALPLHEVLRWLRYDRDGVVPAHDREQHPTGGDLRAHVRRRLDRPWCAALAAEDGDAIALLAACPFDAAGLAEQVDAEQDFAVAYALATDANPPGRRWAAPAPFVADADRDAFEVLAGRGPAASAVRREARLRRWGVSATFPSATVALDRRLVAAAGGLPMLHAAADWCAYLADRRDALAVARRRFVQRVADAVAEQVPA